MQRLRARSTSRSFAALIVLTLTLTVGANLVVFTIVNALWLRPRPVADPGRVVVITSLPVSGDSPRDALKAPMLDGFRRLAVFNGVAGQVATGGLLGDFRPRLVIDRVGHPVETLAVTSQYFTVLGVGVRGRDFAADDDRLGATPVAIISDRLWKHVFGGDLDVVGTIVATSHLPVQIIGVASVGFRGARLGEQIDLWIPRDLVPRVSGLPAGTNSAPFEQMLPLMGLARLRPGVTAAEAERAIALPARRLIVRPLRDVFGTPNLPTIIVREQAVIRILTATAVLVLLAGCATLMALVLVHYERRRQELAVRLALGASRAQLARQLGLELLGLGAAGAASAVAATAWAVRVLPVLSLPGGIDLGRLDLSIDWRVATAGVIAVVVALVVATAIPILRVSRANLVISLISATTTGAPSSLRLRRMMLSLHVAATIIVLVAAGLFVRTVVYGFGQGPGFDVDRTAFLQVQPSIAEFFVPSEGPDQQVASDGRKAAAYARLLDGLSALPGVEAAVPGTAPLLQARPIQPSAVTVGSISRQMPAIASSDPPEYLPALGVRVIAGRTLEPGDAVTTGVRPAVVTVAFAAAAWPASAGIGQEFTAGETYQIVGVISDVVCGSLRTASCARIFTATNAPPSTRGIGMDVTIRARRDAADLVEPVRRLASQIFPNAASLEVWTGRDLVAIDLGQERLGLWFFSGFGIVVLALGLGGVFGLVAYLAESKRRECGVRLALGATHGKLLRQLVLMGVWPVAVGTLAGLIAAALLARTLANVLVGISELDLISYATAAAIMVGGALVAGLAAAWRIQRLSPLEALRAE